MSLLQPTRQPGCVPKYSIVGGNDADVRARSRRRKTVSAELDLTILRSPVIFHENVRISNSSFVDYSYEYGYFEHSYDSINTAVSVQWSN